jgi:hypothetical protein
MAVLLLSTCDLRAAISSFFFSSRFLSALIFSSWAFAMYAVRAFADSSGVGSALRAKDEIELVVEEVWLILVFPGIKAAIEPICVKASMAKC